MKHVTGYLIVMGLLLLGALAAGVYVWYTIQTMNRDLDTVYQSLEDRVEKQRAKAKSSTSTSTEVVLGLEPDSEAIETALIVGADNLTVEQRARLEDLGVEGGSVVITPAFILCASKAAGDVRFREIIDGGAPSPRELEALLPCLKK